MNSLKVELGLARMILHADKPVKVKQLGDVAYPKVMVYQNQRRAPGLMTHAARVLCFSEYCERHGYQLVVDLKTYFNMNLSPDKVGKENSWEYYYEQPFPDAPPLDDVLKGSRFMLSPSSRKFLLDRDQRIQNSRFSKFPLRLKQTDFIDSSVPCCLKRHDIYLRCCEACKKFIRFNKRTKEYTDQEYEELLNGKRVIGVSIRGTDYSVKRTYGHPIQPEINDVIEKVNEYISLYGYDYIYLSCEEYAAVERFRSVFPGMVIINNRKFFDNIDFKTSKTGVWAYGFDRENDAYLRGLEYLSSINLLSKCDALVGGINTGSQMAYIMNYDRYEHVYFYNLGRYGIDDSSVEDMKR